MCILIVCFPGCDAGLPGFEIYHSFFIKPFFYKAKKSELKFQYLESKKGFGVK